MREPAIELRGAACTFGAGESAVRALTPTDLLVAQGDHVAIMGPSGSGKSTLLHILGLLMRPTAGGVLVAGVDVAGLGDAQLSALRGAQLGFVFQAFHLLAHRSVHENVELPLRYARTPPRGRRDRVRSALAQVGLTARAHALPGTLSGGERQRAAIARALVRRPAVLLCDEPTGNLDSRSAGQVLDALDELNAQGITVLTVTHDPGVAARARRLLLLADGAVGEGEAGRRPA